MFDQLAQRWQEILSTLEPAMSKPSFDAWLKPSVPVAIEDGALIVEVPHEFARDWLQSRYEGPITQALRAATGIDLAVRFVVPKQPKTLDAALAHAAPEKDSADAAEVPQPEDAAQSVLNPKYTFSSFVVGNSNRFAHAASLAVAEAPGKAYNPLFIYGGVGLGKTHLMQAIGHYVMSHYPSLKVVYVSCEQFTNELINAIRYEKTLDFREKYRNVGVLLIDDIQFLAGKERTQEEFFHTFNALYEANRQIVISSDRPPKEIATLEDRLRSRFEWGLITDIQAPDLETRIAILKKKASLEKLQVPNDVLVYIANQIHSNIRELEGALIRVVAFASLVNKQITVQLAAEVLRDMLPSSKPKQISIELIQKIVAEYFNLSVDDLTAKKRSRTVSFPRQIAMYLARELTESSLPRIGEEFGGRDHTTVIHACEKIHEDMKNDPTLSATIKEIISKLKAGS